MNLTDYICKDIITNIFTCYIKHIGKKYDKLCEIIPELKETEWKFWRKIPISMKFYRENHFEPKYGYNVYIDNNLIREEGYYESGTPAFEYDQLPYKDGKNIYTYYESGRLRTMHIALTEQNEAWVHYMWDETGILMQESSRSKSGKLHGTTKMYYYPNGNIKAIQNYEEGKKHGKFIEYRGDGEIYLECIYRQDSLISKDVRYK